MTLEHKNDLKVSAAILLVVAAVLLGAGGVVYSLSALARWMVGA
jgi:hypothetical protein